MKKLVVNPSEAYDWYVIPPFHAATSIMLHSWDARRQSTFVTIIVICSPDNNIY